MSNVDTARAAYNAFNTGDLATLKDMWSDNIHWWSSEETKPGGERTGIDSVMELMMQVPDYWSRANVEPQDFIDAGNFVVVRGVQHFTNDRGSADVRFAHILEFDRSGKCVDAEMHTDSAKGSKLQN